MNEALELRDINVRRGSAHILRDVSLNVHPGEVVALLGGNGVGKSTTLRTISGLHKLMSGTILLRGESLSGKRPEEVVRAGVAHVPEGRQVFNGLTTKENLEIGARVRGPLTSSRLESVLELFPDLRALLSRKAGVLSGGQQQMLAIARGLLAEPTFLMLDEPSLGLAPKVVRDIARSIGELSGRGMGILLVEQNASMALDVSDRGYLMATGRIVASGTAEALRTDVAVQEVYLRGTNSSAPSPGAPDQSSS